MLTIIIASKQNTDNKKEWKAKENDCNSLVETMKKTL